MRFLKAIFFLISLFLGTSLFAVGGLKQAEMICNQDTYPGVGILNINYKNSDSSHSGTAQLLPHSHGLLVVTAKHCIEDRDGGPITVTFGNKIIPVVEVFQHSKDQRDIAILRLAESPEISDDLLPHFPTLDFIETYLKKTASGQLVGFGDTSHDQQHPGLLFADDVPQKRFGKITLDSSSNLFSSRDLTSKAWSFTATSYPNDRVFAGAGDSGGPLIIDNTLAGVLVSSTSEKDKTLEESIIFIDDKEARELKRKKVLPINSIPCHKHKVDFYVLDRKILVYIHDLKKDEIHLLAKIKFFVLNNISFQPPWELLGGEKVIEAFLHSPPAQTTHNTSSAISFVAPDENLFSHIDHYVNISKCADFIKSVYDRCGFSISFWDGFYILSNVKEETIRKISSEAVSDHLRQLKKTTDLPVFLKNFERHIEAFIQGKRALGFPVNEYELLLENNFGYHVKRFLKEQDRLMRIPAYLKEIDIKRTSFLPSYSKFREVVKINIIDSEITSIAPLFGLQNLKYLDLTGSLVMSVKPLLGSTQLRELKLNSTPIKDLEGIQNLSTLRRLYLRGTKINDLRIISDMKKLDIVDIRDCPNLDDEESILKMEKAGCYFLRD